MRLLNNSKKSLTNLFLIVMLTLLASCYSNRVKVFDTKCGNLSSPVGVSEDWLKFSWKLKAEKQDVMQSAYQILVSDDLKMLKEDEGNIWNSGKVESDASIQVPYSGKPLSSAKKYYWKIRVWDNEGILSEWSESEYFVTAFFNQNDWQGAQWIVYEEMPDSLRLVPGIHWLRNDLKRSLGSFGQKRYVIPYFRKEFNVPKKVKNAFVAVSGLGHYELSLNGKKVGDHFLAPAHRDMH